MRTVEKFEVLAEVKVNVAYKGNETDLHFGESFAGVKLLVFNHRGEVLELNAIDWNMEDTVLFEEDGLIISDLNLFNIVDIEETNEDRALYSAQLMLNELTVGYVVVTATKCDGTVTTLSVNDFSFNVGSIEN
ncbi:hypothetical protein GCM10009865_47400 [Aeromicrobium ponti]|uniref:Uncharacterized protein n=1 Tax=Cytobacillus oceanisediminis TaxID=665099 RepID=A0A562JCY9_9BACI|nr:hypothetical protein [Cytobacillus oceanisediminis]TWH81017.1 hypothetical protein IQ19_04434 [Cytobacillus oceanisediminis]